MRHDYPHLGSSPDGLISCSCCGDGVLEIKCPFKYRDGLEGWKSDQGFCLDANYNLKCTHPYYSQVQLHMLMNNLQYCDLFIWLREDALLIKLCYDQSWADNSIDKMEAFFVKHILPELFTRKINHELQQVKSIGCCDRPESGKMIACEECGQHIPL